MTVLHQSFPSEPARRDADELSYLGDASKLELTNQDIAEIEGNAR